MQYVIPGDLFLRSLQLFRSNASIAVPLIAAFFLNQAAQVLLRPSTPEATFFERSCAVFIGVFSFSAAYACTLGMAQAAWARGSATFSDAWQAVTSSLDRIILVAIVLQIAGFFPSSLIKQTFSGQDFFSALLTSVSMLLLVVAAFLALSYLLTYMGPSIVIGRKNALKAFKESAGIASRNMGTTLTLTLTTYAVFAGGIAFASSADFSHGQLFWIALYPVLFSCALCVIALLTCGEYITVRGLPAFSLGINQPGKRSGALLAVAYAAALSAAVIFAANGFTLQTYSPSVSFSSKTGNISIDHLLQNFIIETHGVKTNRAVEKQAIDDAYAMVMPHSDAYAYLEAWFPTHDPFALSRKEARFVYQLKMRPADRTNVYAITWHEAVIHPITNAMMRSEQWEAALRVAPDTAPGKAFITQITWKRVR